MCDTYITDENQVIVNKIIIRVIRKEENKVSDYLYIRGLQTFMATTIC